MVFDSGVFQSVNIFVKDTSSLYQKAFSFSIFTCPWFVRLSSEYLQEMIGFCWMANSATANPKVSPNFWAWIIASHWLTKLAFSFGSVILGRKIMFFCGGVFGGRKLSKLAKMK